MATDSGNVGRESESPPATGDIPATEVWLYPGHTTLDVIPGFLEMKSGRIVFTPGAKVSKRQAKHLEEWTGTLGLAERLEQDFATTVLDVDREQVNAKATTLGLGAAIDLEALGHRWRFQFYPNVSGVGFGALIALPWLFINMRKGRTKAVPWRESLISRTSRPR